MRKVLETNGRPSLATNAGKLIFKSAMHQCFCSPVNQGNTKDVEPSEIDTLKLAALGSASTPDQSEPDWDKIDSHL